MSPEIRAACVICGTVRDLVADDTWFFVGGPRACTHVCSRGCLLEYAKKLQQSLQSAACPQCGKLVSFIAPIVKLHCGRCDTYWKPVTQPDKPE